MDPSPSLELVKHVLLAFGVILAAGTACSVLAQKLRIPDVVIFLIVGLLLGHDAIGIINIRVESALNQLVLIFGSVYTMDLSGMRRNI